MSSSEDLSMDNLDSDSLRPVYNLIELGLEEYEDNELVLDTVHDLMQFFKQSNYLRTCYEKVGFKNFFERHFQIRALEKPELELFLKAQLMAFEITNKNEESQRQNYRYNYNASLLLCKPVFLKLCGISDHFLLAIQKHLQEKGLTERTHGNTGRVPKLKSKVFLDSSITFPDSGEKPEAEIKEPAAVTESLRNSKTKIKKARGSDKKPETKILKQRSGTQAKPEAKIEEPEAKIEEPEVKIIKKPGQRTKTRELKAERENLKIRNQSGKNQSV
ncbi:6742_t:CDS:2 [Racocetra fulgida]|uniref:6742_t:CDS:1 n=1 Tax=Racocetra fulgida TaxID=60492 RepID=A0A9N8Z8C1_9GLOM|nr:6742_t:CDS:2 [Racocetra fulgida]